MFCFQEGSSIDSYVNILLIINDLKMAMIINYYAKCVTETKFNAGILFLVFFWRLGVGFRLQNFPIHEVPITTFLL